MRSPFGFPNPVNEVSARLVATGVVVMTVGALAGWKWLLVPLVYGFWARVLTGPTLSPLGQLVTRVVTPRLVARGVQPRPVPGPPKRFAQAMGAALTTTAAVCYFGFGLTGATNLLLAMLVVAASLEAFLGICLGCAIFGVLMKAGVIPASTCEACSNIWARTEVSARA
ncbi:MAG: DUF4395 domain-containing protein [Acidimicrobiia bacterium]